jgi:hypothetical protein
MTDAICTFTKATQLKDPIKFTYVTLAVLSMFGSTLVATTIIYNKKLQTHPQPLIALICLAEGLACYNALIWAINSEFYACYFGLEYLFTWSILFS